MDDGPFYYTTVGGEFEAKVKISGDYKTYTIMRNCWMQDNIPVMVGPVAACPGLIRDRAN